MPKGSCWLIIPSYGLIIELWGPPLKRGTLRFPWIQPPSDQPWLFPTKNAPSPTVRSAWFKPLPPAFLPCLLALLRPFLEAGFFHKESTGPLRCQASNYPTTPPAKKKKHLFPPPPTKKQKHTHQKKRSQKNKNVSPTFPPKKKLSSDLFHVIPFQLGKVAVHRSNIDLTVGRKLQIFFVDRNPEIGVSSRTTDRIFQKPKNNETWFSPLSADAFPRNKKHPPRRSTWHLPGEETVGETETLQLQSAANLSQQKRILYIGEKTSPPTSTKIGVLVNTPGFRSQGHNSLNGGYSYHPFFNAWWQQLLKGSYNQRAFFDGTFMLQFSTQGTAEAPDIKVMRTMRTPRF